MQYLAYAGMVIAMLAFFFAVPHVRTQRETQELRSLRDRQSRLVTRVVKH